MKQQRLITLALLLAILLISIRVAQQFRALHAPTRQVAFTCAVAVQDKVGQVCIEGEPGAQFRITITYCNQQSVRSPVITDQEPGTNEYRWVWQVQQPTNCAGKSASAQASAIWADGSQASAEAVFSVALTAK
ncbi:MAG: hypothetical protein ACRDIV_17810 [Ktedonobacteraceae bacterium]